MAPRNRAEAAGQAAAGAARTALNKAPGSKLAQGLQRVSPGVYRNAAGQLTNSGGKAMPGQASRLPQGGRGPGGMAQGVAQGVGAAIGGQARGGGMGGGMAQGIAQGVGASLGGGMRSPIQNAIGGANDAAGGRPAYLDVQRPMNDLMGQAQLSDQQMQDLRNQMQQIQQNGGMGGMGGGMGQPQPGLEEIARSRAEAIARGDSVTMDYNPEREALVNQYLQQMGRPQVGGMNGMTKPNTVSGTLQRGPTPRPNPFEGMGQAFGQGFGQGMGVGAQAPQDIGAPGSVSGMLQRGPAPRPNPFQGFAQGIGRGLGGRIKPF